MSFIGVSLLFVFDKFSKARKQRTRRVPGAAFTMSQMIKIEVPDGEIYSIDCADPASPCETYGHLLVSIYSTYIHYSGITHSPLL